MPASNASRDVATWFTGSGHAVGGLDGGSVASTGTFAMALTGYSDVLGLRLSGRLTLSIDLSSTGQTPTFAPIGSLTVSGPRAAHGVITFAAHGSVKARWAPPK